MKKIEYSVLPFCENNRSKTLGAPLQPPLIFRFSFGVQPQSTAHRHNREQGEAPINTKPKKKQTQNNEKHAHNMHAQHAKLQHVGGGGNKTYV